MHDEYIYLWAQWGMVNAEQFRIVIQTFGNLERAFREVTPDFFRQLKCRPDKIERAMKIREALDFHWIVSQMKAFDIRLVYLDDDKEETKGGYPDILRQISDPPVFLFVRGQLPSFHKSMAVVGTRGMTPYGEMVTTKFTRDLVRNGFVIVSGMAMGVDACAHQAALDCNGITVAVLGTGVDLLHPSCNEALGKRIIKSGGAVVSDYPLGTEGMPHHFRDRNRIIAGLSTGILVTEGGSSSGALITAKNGLEENRAIFSVPCAVNKHALSGTNKIIRKSEAKLVERVEDILEDMKMNDHKQGVSPADFSPFERDLLDSLRQDGKSLDQLTHETGVNVARLSESLIRLQLRGVVREMGRRWIIV